MEYSKIISVTGLGGLFELLSSKSDGAIVRSLDDKTTKFVSSRVHNFSHLESIEVYTVRDNVNLVEIFQAMEKSNESVPDEKDNNAVMKYYQKVFPDLDFDRVYASDMKKMVKWFGILKANEITIELPEPEPEPEPIPEPVKEKAKEEPAVKSQVPEKATKSPKKAAEPKAAETKEAAKKKPKEEKKETKPAAKKAAKETPKKSTKEAAKKSAKSAPDKSAKKKKSGK